MPKPLKKKLKAIPKFKSEAAEREFWRRHDTVDYVDWEHARRVALPRLRPSTETISLRLPVPLLADLKSLANERDVPYQSLLKVFLAERVAQEWAAQRRNARDEALWTAGPARGRELI
ncbi:MAG TPA: BrnA antitoxin family protein [Terriglobales bacterium]|nr:BrnA antitoxin family protein [Terriglobales bacterium]